MSKHAVLSCLDLFSLREWFTFDLVYTDQRSVSLPLHFIYAWFKNF